MLKVPSVSEEAVDSVADPLEECGLGYEVQDVPGYDEHGCDDDVHVWSLLLVVGG